MVGNISNNPYNVNANNTANETAKAQRRVHMNKQNANNNIAQKPDAVSGATKKSGGDHYFDAQA